MFGPLDEYHSMTAGCDATPMVFVVMGVTHLQALNFTFFQTNKNLVNFIKTLECSNALCCCSTRILAVRNGKFGSESYKKIKIG